MAANWVVKQGGKDFGPYTDEQLKQLANRGQVGPSDQIFNVMKQQWLPAYQIRGLLPAATANIASPPMPPPSNPQQVYVGNALSGDQRPARRNNSKVLAFIGIGFLLAAFFNYSKQNRDADERLRHAQISDDTMNRSAELFGLEKKNEVVKVKPADQGLTYFLAGAGVLCWVAGFVVERRS